LPLGCGNFVCIKSKSSCFAVCLHCELQSISRGLHFGFALHENEKAIKQCFRSTFQEDEGIAQASGWGDFRSSSGATQVLLLMWTEQQRCAAWPN